MHTIRKYNNTGVKIEFLPGLIRIYSNAAFWSFLEQCPVTDLEAFIKTLKGDYQQKYHKTLKIGNNSLFVEIVGHVYFDYLARKLKRLCGFKWGRKQLIKLIKRAEVIDCGESTVDGNRWLWDALTFLKPVISRLMPENLEAKKLGKV